MEIDSHRDSGGRRRRRRAGYTMASLTTYRLGLLHAKGEETLTDKAKKSLECKYITTTRCQLLVKEGGGGYQTASWYWIAPCWLPCGGNLMTKLPYYCKCCCHC